MNAANPAKPDFRFDLLGAALCACAAAYNLWQSWQTFGTAPMSDPASYPALAQASRWFYDSGIREPLPVFLVKAGLSFGLSPDMAVRLPALALALLSGPALCLLAWPLFGGPAAYTAGMLLSLNPWLGFYACAGSNSVHAAFFFSLFLLLLLRGDSAKTALAAGLAAGLAALSRLETAGVAAALCALYAVGPCLHPQKKFPFLSFSSCGMGRLRRAALALAVCAVLAAPYLIYQKAHFGSFMHSHGLHARFWVNAAQGVPPGPKRYEPGPADPSAPLMREGIYAVPKILLKGYWTALRRTPELLRSELLFAAAACGALCSPFVGGGLVLLAVALSLFPVAPIMNLDQAGPGSGVEMRFLFHTLWLWCLCAGLGLEAALRARKRRNAAVELKPAGTKR